MEQSVGNTKDAFPSYEGSESQKKKKQVKRKLPTPRELVSLYESQGMDTQEASLKVIEDLQNALFRMTLSSSGASTGRSNKQGPSSSDTSRKLDIINARLLQLDMKVDSKPSYPQTLAIGITSGALLHVFGSAAAQIWTAVRRVTSNSCR
ncbi:hypothetical protein ACH5RR_018383 [Cinchona calisaya]|uniref:Uncharacterized protein n=1 Tax=Cinchona calisaya TaxID=153742 RepID=A0ABD2ZM72_9GENT